MAVVSDKGLDMTQTDDIHQMALSVILEITDTFQQIQTVVAKRKALLLREVTLVETRLRRERSQRSEDMSILVRARDSLEETLNTNRYKELRDDLLVRLDNSLEKENEHSKVDGFRFISRGIKQLKDCISKFGAVARNDIEDDSQVFEDDTISPLTLPLRNLASPRMTRKWTDPGQTSLTRQISTPSYLTLPLSPTRPRGFSKHTDTSSTLSHSFSFNNPREIPQPTKLLGTPNYVRKTSFNH
ncbi:hypothetical protein LOD99_11101 [Oopsacas minuta]|uniref:Uncharacterized protein n=1 Tax=Oopsacas minuta TaxID=111878 RepID=A0AAV7KBB5_9METZ|nr:hypothetical protein LOD99_11101 [Oopsacas minuta]